jgi:hypothetical protein
LPIPGVDHNWGGYPKRGLTVSDTAA